MCGITGYIGPEQAVPVLMRGLADLAVRGYDSAGIAVLDDDAGLRLEKSEGKLERLQARLTDGWSGRIGIGHTRWATHGRPSDVNAHPHTDCSGKFAVVHNGIIENHQTLRNWLVKEGHRFLSETDTEVLPHLVEHFYQGDLLKAVSDTVARVEGFYAVAFMSAHEPDRLIAVRRGSPLVIGLGQNGHYLASDILPVLAYTRQVFVLDDGEIAVITRDGVQVYDQDLRVVAKEILEVDWEGETAEKGGFEHYMLKEIWEQPQALKNALSGRILPDGTINLDEVKLDVRGIRKISIVACGTAYHAGLVAKHVLETLARIPVEVDLASEFRYRNPLVDQDTLVVVISQSGETADTLVALREARKKGARILAITNVVGSSVAREADDVIYTRAGPEIAIASTKAYVTQLVGGYLLSLYLAQARGTMPAERINTLARALQDLPARVETVLAQAPLVKQWAERLAGWEDAFFIGRGMDYVVALEGALKLKETSYLHAEAHAAGEFKHGSVALVKPGIPVIALCTQEHIREKTVNNIKAVKACGAYVTALVPEGEREMAAVADEVLYLPAIDSLWAAVLSVVPLQLLAYYTSLARGCNVDQPRNLTKSVMVE